MDKTVSWRDTIGKRVLIKNYDGLTITDLPIIEIVISEVSPSGKYIKFEDLWHESSKIDFIEILD